MTPLDNFLLAERKGYCDFYASAACLMLRLGEIPCRIAYGYASDDYDAEKGVWTFTDRSAHAWTEIFLDGRAGRCVISRLLPTSEASETGSRKSQSMIPLMSRLMRGQSWRRRSRRRVPRNQFSLSAWWQEIMEKAAALNSSEQLLMAVGACRYCRRAPAPALAVQIRRREKQARDTFSEDEKQPAYYAEFLRNFHQAGFPRAPGATPREYFDFGCTGAAGRELSPMIAYHYHRRYADAEPDRTLGG